MGAPRPSGPRSSRRVALLAAAACLVGGAIALVFVARRPEPAAPLAPASVATDAASTSPAAGRSQAPRKPLGAAVLEHWQRRRASAAAPDADALPGLIALALDPRAQLAERADAVSALALSADDSAFAALERVLAEGSPLAAFAAEALGGSPHPRAVPLLVDLAGSSEEAVALGALRGLARAGGAQATAALAATLRRRGALAARALAGRARARHARHTRGAHGAARGARRGPERRARREPARRARRPALRGDGGDLHGLAREPRHAARKQAPGARGAGFVEPGRQRAPARNRCQRAATRAARRGAPVARAPR